jgi:hypothetical protein
MLSGSLIAFFSFLLPYQLGHCAPTEYTVHIGTQATIVGHEYDNPAGRFFAGIRYAQPMSSTNRFMVRFL